MQFEFNFTPGRSLPGHEILTVNGQLVAMILVRNHRARRYVLRLRPDGSARVTIPRGGSAAEARRFAERNKGWLERQLHRLVTRPHRPKAWPLGTQILFRGELVTIEAGLNGDSGMIRFGSESVRADDGIADMRPVVEKHLWRVAAKELPRRVLEFAAQHQIPVRRVTVRNQRSRWGSCSRRGTISLNWRLIQAPAHVCDYIILHELCHLRQMNHSRRFWREVERLCPDFRTAERWLKQHSVLLR